MNPLRTFYILVVTQTLSMIGSRMTGMASILVVTGVIIIMMTLAVYTIPSIRQLDARLPNYVAAVVE